MIMLAFEFMEKTKSNIKFSNKHDELGEAVEAALKKVSQNIIEETKKQNSYLVVTDEDGNIKHIPAKDL